MATAIKEPKTQPSNAPSARKERSPNYPSITFSEALERVKKVYAAEKKHDVDVKIAVKHMGYTYNGRSRMSVAALKQYGLLASVGSANVRVTDDAAAVIVYPETEPRRTALIKTLAMKPKAFTQIVTKFGTSLPSDENLKAHLVLEMGFTGEACDVFIKVLKHALAIAGDVRPASPDAVEAETSSSNSDPGAETAVPPPPPVTPGLHEHHKWKLAEGVWAEISLTGRITAKHIEKLRKYVDLLDVSEGPAEM